MATLNVQNDFRILLSVTFGMSFNLLHSGGPDPVLREAVQPGFLSYQVNNAFTWDPTEVFLTGRTENPAGLLPSGLGLDTTGWVLNRFLVDGFMTDQTFILFFLPTSPFCLNT